MRRSTSIMEAAAANPHVTMVESPVSMPPDVAQEWGYTINAILFGLFFGSVSAPAAYVLGNFETAMLTFSGAAVIGGIFRIALITLNQNRVERAYFSPPEYEPEAPAVSRFVQTADYTHAALPEGFDVDLLRRWAAACVAADYDMRIRTWTGAGNMLTHGDRASGNPGTFETLVDWLVDKGYGTKNRAGEFGFNDTGRERVAAWAAGDMRVI